MNNYYKISINNEFKKKVVDVRFIISMLNISFVK